MKLFTLTALVLAGALSAFKPAAKVEKFTVDTQKSTISWVGSKVGGQHTGTLNLKSGTVLMNGNRLAGGTFSMDMTSIKVTDIQGEDAEKLRGHLSSDDFFGVSKYPEASFTVTRVSATGAASAAITGKLLLKGVTKTITFPAVIKRSGNVVTATAQKVSIDRTQHGIRYKSKSVFSDLGDKFIHDDFVLSVNLVAKK